MAGLTTVEGAVFALIGLLLAFTISGALQRFDERADNWSFRRQTRLAQLTAG
jgi:type II secretory pathway pseudopilin PulG